MKKTLAALGIGALVLTLSACGPEAGKRCTTPGEVRQDEKTGMALRCQTNEGDKLPTWTEI